MAVSKEKPSSPTAIMAAEGAVDGIGLAVAARDGGGAEIHIGAALEEDVGAGAGALAVAAAGDDGRSGFEAGELGGLGASLRP